MSKVLTDQIEKRTGGTAMDVPTTGKWPTANIADGAITQVKLAVGAGGTGWQAVVATNTTMSTGLGYFVNTTAGIITMTLPASASIGDNVHVIDYAGTFDSNACTIGRNGHNIAGAASDLLVQTERAALKLVYVDATQGWLLTEV